MAKEKATSEKTDAEITFFCKFCGKSKPLSEMTLQKRFFPVLTACRECERVLQSLQTGDIAEEVDEGAGGTEDPDEDN